MSADATIPASVEAVKDDAENVEVPAMEQDEKDSSQDEIQQLKNQIKEMAERQQQQSALIGKLNNALKREAKEESEPEPKQEGEISKYSELEKKLDSYAERFKKQEKAAKLNAVELALIEAGADPSLAKSQSEFYAYKLGDRLQAVDDNGGRMSIEVSDTDGLSVPVESWAKAFLESDDGLYMKAVRKGPSVNNKGESSGGPGKKVALKPSDYSLKFAEANAKGPQEVESFKAAYTMQ